MQRATWKSVGGSRSSRRRVSARDRARTVRFESLESRQLNSVSLSMNGPQTISPEPTVDVSNDNAFGQSGMAIEIDPTRPLRLAGVSQHVGGAGAMNEIDVYRSADGGKHW